MIRSMTGFGIAEGRCDQWTLRAEVRTVNHRDLQLSLRLPDAFRVREYELQKLIEKQIRRGHLYLSLTCEPATAEGELLVDAERLKAYVAALKGLAADTRGLPVQVDLASLLRLPGALKDVTTDAALRDEIWPRVVTAVQAALDALVEMRRAEGASLHAELHRLCDAIEGLAAAVEREQGGLVAAYRDRLRERLAKLLEGMDVPLGEDSLAREVALYADRSDVGEEIARLKSHLQQFREALDGEEAPVGRKMEFLGQEMLREASTMAAKVAAGPQVRQVLELKGEIERVREQVRNVE
jgi:uncharacterized protein (TIGR00255 family)